MISNHQRRAVERIPAPAQFAHRRGRPKKSFHRHGTKRDNHFRFDDIDLLHQIRPAGLHLARRRRAISERTSRHVRAAFENVGDVNLFPRKTHCLDNFGKQLAGATDERFALRIFIRPRCFSDEHDIGVRIADSENGLRPRAREVWAFRASSDSALNRGQLFDLVDACPP